LLHRATGGPHRAHDQVVDGSAANAKRCNPRLADDRSADDYITTE
jgi:hypothetical protein